MLKRLTSVLVALLIATPLVGCGHRNPLGAGKGGESGTIEVSVTQDGEPAAGAMVQLRDSDSAALEDAQADEDGKAVFETVKVGAGYSVTAEYNGATDTQSDLRVTAGQKTLVKLSLKAGNGPGGIIAGTVKIHGTERTLPGVKVEVVSARLSVTTDQTGHYSLEEVPAGLHQIKASYAGFIDAVRDVNVKAGSSNTLVIELYPQSAGGRASHTVITTMARIVEVDQWHNPVWDKRTGETWSAQVTRPSGTMLVADAAKNTVAELTEKGTLIKSFNATSFWRLGFGGLRSPRGATRTHTGTVLVADTGNNRVVEVDASDRKVWELKTRLNAPRWAERLRTGNTLVVDTGNNRIVEVNTSGTPVWGLGDGSTGILNRPAFAQRLPNGNTLVTDAGNSRVMEVNPHGMLVWMVGGSRPVADDKNLSNPNCAMRLPSGNTLIADTGNNRVIEVDGRNQIVWLMPIAQPLFVDRI